MKLLKYITAIAGIVLFFTTCKKYPQGGFQNRATKHILATWHLDLYEVNGIDSTNLINNNGEEMFKEVSVNKNGTKTSLSISVAGFTYGAHLTDNNQILSVTGHPNPVKCNVYQGQTYCWRAIFSPEGNNSKWTIVKLKKNEFVLALQENASYLIKLSK